METRRATTDHRYYSVCLATLGTPAWMRFYHEIVFGACVLGLACCWPQPPPTHPSVGQYLLNMPIIPSLPTQMHAAVLQGEGQSRPPSYLRHQSATSTSRIGHGIGIGMRPPTSATTPSLLLPQTNRSIPFIPCHIDRCLLCIHPQIPSPPNNSSLLLLGFL